MVKLMKPSFDTRFGNNAIKSACGISAEADFVVENSDDITELGIQPNTYLLVDEIQFFTIDHIMQLRQLSHDKNIYVECYGLLKDFRNDMFYSSAKLVEVADELLEIKTFCYLCSKKSLSTRCKNANFNMKIFDDCGVITPTLEGESCECGGIEKYVPTCSKCYFTAFKEVEVTKFILSQKE